MKDLGIDPSNLKFEFEQRWNGFRVSNVHKFLSAYLAVRIEILRAALENCPMEEVKQARGSIAEARSLLKLLESPQVNDKLTEVMKFIDNH